MSIFQKKSLLHIRNESERSQLKKSLTAKDLAFLGMGCVIGTGIFVATGQGAHVAGPGIIISFIITAIISGLCGLIYSELATMFPVAGSSYSYSYIVFGEFAAWLVGWNLILVYLINASAVGAGWSATFVGILHSMGIDLPKALTASRIADPQGIIDLPAMLITLLVTYLLFIGVSESAKANNIMVVIKVSVILVFIVLGFSHIDIANLQPLMPFGWSGLMSGAAIIFFAYTGFDAISTAAEESVNPSRDVPLGLIICLVTVSALYIVVALVLTGMIPFREIDVLDALPAALSSVGIHWGSALVAVGGIIGMVSALLVTLYGQIRIFMVMSRDGLLPKKFAKIHPVHKTPHYTTWITGILCAIVAGILPLPMIIDLTNLGTLSAFVLVSVSVIVLRKTMPDVERKFRVPLVPFIPIITIVGCLYLMIHISGLMWLNFAIWLIIGASVYFMYGYRSSVLRSQDQFDKPI